MPVTFASIEAERTPPGKEFWLALYLVIWDTAERIRAVISLRWDRVDLKNGWVRFDAEDRKGATADTAAPIAAETVEALKRIKRPEGLVFRWPYSETYLYRKLGKIMARAGLPDNRLYKFHAIRKSVASHYETAAQTAAVMFHPRHERDLLTTLAIGAVLLAVLQLVEWLGQ